MGVVKIYCGSVTDQQNSWSYAEDAPNVTNKDPSATVNTTSAMGDDNTKVEKEQVSQEEEEKVKPRIWFVFELSKQQVISIYYNMEATRWFELLNFGGIPYLTQ